MSSRVAICYVILSPTTLPSFTLNTELVERFLLMLGKGQSKGVSERSEPSRVNSFLQPAAVWGVKYGAAAWGWGDSCSTAQADLTRRTQRGLVSPEH